MRKPSFVRGIRGWGAIVDGEEDAKEILNPKSPTLATYRMVCQIVDGQCLLVIVVEEEWVDVVQ